MEAIRMKWIGMTDADKCQYNGYNDFFAKQQERMKIEATNRAIEKKEAEKIRKMRKG